MSLLAALALLDAAAGVYLLQHAIRRQRAIRDVFLVVALVLLACAAALAVLTLPKESGEPGRLPPLPGQRV